MGNNILKRILRSFYSNLFWSSAAQSGWVIAFVTPQTRKWS